VQQTPADREKHLRLASAQRKTRSFLAQISQLEASEFPHPDAKDALTYVKAKFSRHETRLRSISLHSLAIDNACLYVIHDILRYTKVLGLILRSTNVRNPFEIHDIALGKPNTRGGINDHPWYWVCQVQYRVGFCAL